MDAQELRKQINGKSFQLNNTSIVYTFIKDTDTLDISGTGEVNKVHYSIQESEVHLLLDFEFSQEMFGFTVLSRPYEPFSFQLWGNDTRKIFGVLTEISK